MNDTSELRDGIRDVVPIIIAMLPFGAVFGALATDSGLTLAQAVGFSATIYAGASQLVILQLIALGSPVWSILIAAVAINFRFVLYSASLGRRLDRFNMAEKALAFHLLVDPLFASAELRSMHRTITKRYYFAYGLALYLAWILATLIGFLFGGLIGDQRALGLDIMVPVYFLALTMGFRGRSNFLPTFAAAALVSVGVYLTLGPPWHVMLGGVAGIAVAALRTPPEGGRR